MSHGCAFDWSKLSGDLLAMALVEEAEVGAGNYITRGGLLRAAEELQGLRQRLLECCPACRMQLADSGFLEPQP